VPSSCLAAAEADASSEMELPPNECMASAPGILDSNWSVALNVYVGGTCCIPGYEGRGIVAPVKPWFGRCDASRGIVAGFKLDVPKGLTGSVAEDEDEDEDEVDPIDEDGWPVGCEPARCIGAGAWACWYMACGGISNGALGGAGAETPIGGEMWD